MVALSMRCEEQIMNDPNVGDRTGQWFWNMIVNLGLGGMDDRRFDESYADEVLDRFMNREYAPDGKGGLFTIENRREDMRSMEIWYQMNHYLENYL
jgi:hypothetical protein